MKLETPIALADWDFRGWSTSTSATARTLNNGTDEVTLEEETPYYASYKRDVTVIYDLQGGKIDGKTEIDPSTGTAYKNYNGTETPATITLPSAPTRDNYDFLGWTNVEGAEEAKWDANTPQTFLKKRNTIYAFWRVTGYYCSVCGNYFPIKHYTCNSCSTHYKEEKTTCDKRKPCTNYVSMDHNERDGRTFNDTCACCGTKTTVVTWTSWVTCPSGHNLFWGKEFCSSCATPGHTMYDGAHAPGNQKVCWETDQCAGACRSTSTSPE